MATAVYPGSFDPITLGHLDIIKRTAAVFDKVIIGVLINKAKKPLFSIEERVELIKEVTKDIPNVEIVSFNGLLIEFSDKMKADVIVRGIRAVSDFEYELMMAQTNKQLKANIETMFFAKKWNSIVELLWNFFVEVQVELLGNSISLYFSFFNTFQA